MRIGIWLFLAGCGPATAVLGEPEDTAAPPIEGDGAETEGSDSTGGSTGGDASDGTDSSDGNDTPDGDPSGDDGSTGDDGGPSDPPDGGDTNSGGSDGTDPSGGGSGAVVWRGVRVFDVEAGWGREACTAEVTESGVDVTGNAAYEDATSTCGSCDYVFRVEVGPDSICGDIAIATEVFRGVEYRADGTARLYRIDPYGAGWYRSLLADGELSGSTIAYTYYGEAYGRDFSVAGKVDIFRE
jgi:hypothetical protein